MTVLRADTRGVGRSAADDICKRPRKGLTAKSHSLREGAQKEQICTGTGTDTGGATCRAKRNIHQTTDHRSLTLSSADHRLRADAAVRLVQRERRGLRPVFALLLAAPPDALPLPAGCAQVRRNAGRLTFRFFFEFWRESDRWVG